MPKLGTVASVKAVVPDAVFKRAREILTSSKLQNAVFEGASLEKGIAMCQGIAASQLEKFDFNPLVTLIKPVCGVSCPEIRVKSRRQLQSEHQHRFGFSCSPLRAMFLPSSSTGTLQTLGGTLAEAG